MKIAVTTTREANEELKNKALNIAKDLELTYINRENLSLKETLIKANEKYLMVIEEDKISIKSEDSNLFWHPNMSELKIKSLEKGNKEALTEAVNLKSGDSILDCTLGLAGDSLVFAYVVGESGRVVGTEINKTLSYITSVGLKTYKNKYGVNPKYMNYIEVVNTSYEDYLKKQKDNSFDVVYFDPMFKKENKKSQSINAFREFANHKRLDKGIINEALRVCRKRVVIKERYNQNDIYELGIDKYYGSKKNGSIIYGVIEKI